MSTLLSQPAGITPEDLLRMPDAVSYELVDGKLVERHVSMESSRVALRIGRILGNEAERTGECTVYPPDLGYQCFPDDPRKVRKPDVWAIRKEKLAALGVGDRGYSPIPADLAIEVVSPSDTEKHLTRKIDAYLRGGSKSVWVVFPEARSVMVHTQGSVRALKVNQSIEDPLLPGFSCPVAAFFELT